ncbi:MAG: hypothetical protein WCK56_16230 [Alcaligenaceae bacterium]
MTKVHLQNKWAETNNSVCALLRQAHDVLALTSLPMQQVKKPLTDEEIKEAANSCVWSEAYHVDFARAIEAKLKEKND